MFRVRKKKVAKSPKTLWLGLEDKCRDLASAMDRVRKKNVMERVRKRMIWIGLEKRK